MAGITNWSALQRDRLGIEKETLEKYFNRINWIDPRGETKVEVNFLSNSDKAYKLRIYIPADFPNSCPKLAVVSPRNLVTCQGNPVPTRSSPYHTLEKIDGLYTICHYHPPSWTSDTTLYQVFMKGRLWIEAYEAHLTTGKPLDSYLGHQKVVNQPSDSWIPYFSEEEVSYDYEPRRVVGTSHTRNSRSRRTVGNNPERDTRSRRINAIQSLQPPQSVTEQSRRSGAIGIRSSARSTPSSSSQGQRELLGVRLPADDDSLPQFSRRVFPSRRDEPSFSRHDTASFEELEPY